MSNDCCCFGNNPDEACGYPPKTVRAIISVTACLISFIVMAFLAIFFAIKEQYTEAMGVLGILSTELGTIVGYYFGTKNKSETKAEIIDIEKAIARERDFELIEKNHNQKPIVNNKFDDLEIDDLDNS